jgi:hypothetical protein
MILLLAVLALLAVLPAAAPAKEAGEGGPDHVVRVENDENGTQRARAGVRVGSTDSDTVTSTNLAYARSHHCDAGCESRAAAFQVVFMTGSPTTVSPRNVAIALNEECQGCATFAFAYQYVVQTGDRVRLSDDTRDAIAEIRDEARDDIRLDLPYPELHAQLHELAQRLRAVIDAELSRDRTHVEDRESYERHREGDD